MTNQTEDSNSTAADSKPAKRGRGGRPKGRKTTKPNAKKPGPRFNPIEREEVKRKVQSLQLRGYSEFQIAQKLDVSVSTVNQMSRAIREEYRTARIVEKVEHVNGRLAALAMVKQEAWEQWERSKEDLIRTIQEAGQAGESAWTKERVEREGRLAFKPYMDVFMKAWAEETELLGFTPAPPKPETNVNFFNVDWNKMLRPPDVPDPVQAKLDSVRMLPPKTAETPNAIPTPEGTRAAEAVPV